MNQEPPCIYTCIICYFQNNQLQRNDIMNKKVFSICVYFICFTVGLYYTTLLLHY